MLKALTKISIWHNGFTGLIQLLKEHIYSSKTAPLRLLTRKKIISINTKGFNMHIQKHNSHLIKVKELSLENGKKRN